MLREHKHVYAVVKDTSQQECAYVLKHKSSEAMSPRSEGLAESKGAAPWTKPEAVAACAKPEGAAPSAWLTLLLPVSEGMAPSEPATSCRPPLPDCNAVRMRFNAAASADMFATCLGVASAKGEPVQEAHAYIQ